MTENQRPSAALTWRYRMLFVALCWTAIACTVDLNSRTEPLSSSDDLTGQVPLFGVYSGVLTKNGRHVGIIEIISDDCGSKLSGSLSFADNVGNALLGIRSGSAITLETIADDVTVDLTGAVDTFREINGTWAASDGAGGTWRADYVDGSVEDHPCPFAENLLESNP